jgi:hypothetical protein
MKRHDKAPNGHFAEGMILYGNLESGATAAQGFILEPPDLQSASVALRNEFQDKLRIFLATLGPRQRAQLQWTCNSDYRKELTRYHAQTGQATDEYVRTIRQERFSRYWQRMMDRTLRREQLVLFVSHDIESSSGLVQSKVGLLDYYYKTLQQLRSHFDELGVSLMTIFGAASRFLSRTDCSNPSVRQPETKPSFSPPPMCCDWPTITYVSFSTAKDFRTRQCWMIACGPSMNLALLGVGLLVPFFCDTSLLPYATGWCLAQVYLCLLSIIPHMAKFPDKPRPNDGLLFWQTLRLADVEVERYVLAGRVSLQFCESEALARSLTIEELNGRHEAEPANLPILWHLAHRLADLNDPRCGLYFGKLVAHPDLPEAYLSEAIDFVITQRLGIGPPENFEEADRLSQQLLALSNSISTRGTRGSVLVDIGRIEEGKALLQDVLAKTDSTIDKVYSNVFLALAEKQLGNLELALGYARAAAKVDTHCPALTRVADLLDPQAKRPAQVAASTI